MATAAARAARNREVRQRLDAALERIGKRLDVDFPDEPRRAKDPELQPILELERFVACVELIEHALAAMAGEGEAPGGYETWTVAMLREEIAARGLETGGARSKAELVDVLLDDDTAPEVSEEDEAEDSDA